jgi:Ca2+-binding EF-hand superfamily protein
LCSLTMLEEGLMSVHHYVIALAVAALPLAGEAAAQDAWRFRGWDRNSDGMISRAEWRGTLEAFNYLDRNGDGMLSAAELRDRRGQSDDQWDATAFANLDRNNDNRLTRSEWLGERTTFREVDRNGDNVISRGEFMNANVRDEYELSDFRSLDSDRNGRIERDEWTGTVATFRRLDVNDDGVLSPRELAANDAAGAGREGFDALDDNNDGVISRGEWRAGYGNFNQYDANRDGVISRREYSLAGSEPGSGFERRTIRIDAQQPWVNTGIYVTAGDVVTYQAEGDIQMSTNVQDRATPAGSITGRTANNAPRPDQKAGGLLARVGGSAIAFLGANGSFVAQNSGELLLGINDDHFPDNSGEYRVLLSVQQR